MKNDFWILVLTLFQRLPIFLELKKFHSKNLKMSDHSMRMRKTEILSLKDDLEILKKDPAQFEKKLNWQIAQCKKNSANLRLGPILLIFN